MSTILFLCSGNYYRSRTAELLFNQLASEKGLPWRAISRGFRLSPNNHGPISPFALAFCQSRNIPCDLGRMPLVCTEEDLEHANRVIALKEAEHRLMAREKFPEWENRIEYWKIDDIDAALPSEALPILEQQIQNLITRLSNNENEPPAG